jgi:IS30 family transposase
MWPFETWGLDLLGPFKKPPGGYTHLLVTIDKFTKWIEAKPITQVRSEDVMEFFHDNVYRFGVLNSIIIDNGTLFTGKKFLLFCDNYDIQVDWASVAHPQTNGQVEHMNAMIL